MLPDGVYLGLPFDEYLEEDALGSSDKGTLWLRREGYWWKHRAQTRTKRKTTPEQLFGQAAHAVLLESLHAYETRFFVVPAREDYPDALTTVDQMKAALKEAGLYPDRTTGWVKEDWCEAMESYLPDVEVWDNIQADAARRAGITRNGSKVERQPISTEDDFAIRAMHALATEDYPGNEEIRELLSVGSKFPILSEVSVFYTDENGVRHRARFDRLLPVATMDLKTVGEWRGRALADSLDDHIKRNGYDVQLADYHIARQHMIAMLTGDDAESFLHGGTEEERKHLLAMARWNLANGWDWLWIFYQKPTAAGNAPVLFPLRQAWRSAYHLAGFRKRHAALTLWHACMRRFGPDRPWGRIEALHWTTPEDAPKDAPSITTSPYEWGPQDPAPGEEEHFG